MDEIGKLRRSKKAAAGVDKKGEQAGLSEKRVDELRAEIKEADNELNAIKEEQVFSRPLFHVVDVPSSRCTRFPTAWGIRHELLLGVQLKEAQGSCMHQVAAFCLAVSSRLPTCKRWHPSQSGALHKASG